MARKVFISVLGTGLYESCKYTASNFCSTETRFVQQATLEYLNAKEWPEDSKAYFLLTDKARTDNWIVEGDQRFKKQVNASVPYLGLKKILASSLLPFQCEGVSIPDGKNETEMWKIFETAFKLLKGGDELYLDLTHSFRYLPMLMLVLGNYSKFLKKTTICSITYGNYEARNEASNEAPIVDLLPLSSLQDWTFATADFLKNGYADDLVELADKGLNPLMRNDETRTEETKRLNNFVKNLKNFSLQMQTCRGMDVIGASSIKKIKLNIESLNEVVIPQMEPVLLQVSESIEPFNDAGSVMNAFTAAQWCYNNLQYQQATTFLEEGVISYFCQRHGIALDARKKRELITSAFYIIANNNPEEEWKIEKELKDLFVEIVNDELLRNEHLVKVFQSLVELRNDYNHCGMRNNKKGADKIPEDVKSRLDTIIPIFKQTNDNPCIKDKESCLINLSNHPSQFWSNEQVDAASVYGRIIDLPFPIVSPEINEDDIRTLAQEYIEKIMKYDEKYHTTVHIMGEMTFTFMVVSKLKDMGIECIASTTDRNAEELFDGRKISGFQFVRFRRY